MKKIAIAKELIFIGLASVVLSSCGGGSGNSAGTTPSNGGQTPPSGGGTGQTPPSGGGTGQTQQSGGSTGQTNPTCPAGQYWNGSQCVCLSSDMFINHQCIPSATATVSVPIYENPGYYNVLSVSLTLNGNVINNVILDTGQGGGLVLANSSITNGNYGVSTGQSCSGQYGGGQSFTGQLYSATVCMNGLCTTMTYCSQTAGNAFGANGINGDLGVGCSDYFHACFPALLGYHNYSFSFISLTNNAEVVSSTTPIGYLIFGGSVSGNYTTISYNGYNTTMYSPSATSSSVSYSTMFDTGTGTYTSFGSLLQQLPNWSSSSSQYLDGCYIQSGYTLYSSNTNSNLYLFSFTTYDPNQGGYGNLINNVVCYAGDSSHPSWFNFEDFGMPFFLSHQVEYDLNQNGLTYQIKVSN
ncbi:hypothetical protein [Desulfurella sp.]|uniref:hypothetical protein n=1 Tax=Desulfurella sp. TaxID=1962857 RepID=UPI0025C48C6C|nr:hypothetical protein [Desulfurella sp.]